MSARREGRLLLANLDCDVRYARDDAEERCALGRNAPSPADPRFGLRPAVLARIAALGTLFRVLGEEGDALWVPAPVDPVRIPPAPGVVVPALESDRSAVGLGGVLAWAGEDLTARRANDRELGLSAAAAAGTALPGSRVVTTVAALDVHLAGGGLEIAPGGRWVLKAPFGSAGRNRILGRGARPRDDVRRAAERLLALFGRAVFEPWMERTADAGVFVEGGVCRPPHEQTVGADGSFRGVRIGPGVDRPAEAVPVLAAAEAALAACGYRGPWGIDSFWYRDSAGSKRFHPLGEINARWTFGGLAWHALERVCRALDRPALGELRLGDRETLAAAVGERRRDTVPLLLPGAGDPTSAWLELWE